MKKVPSSIQLEGNELNKMIRLMSRVESDLLKLADRVLTYLYGASHGLRVKSLRVIPNNRRTAILDSRGKVIGVWQDPPGVCRKARKGEKFD